MRNNKNINKKLFTGLLLLLLLITTITIVGLSINKNKKNKGIELAQEQEVQQDLSLVYENENDSDDDNSYTSHTIDATYDDDVIPHAPTYTADSNRWDYTTNNDGTNTITLTKILPRGTGDSTVHEYHKKIVIPSTIGGYTVTRIGSNIVTYDWSSYWYGTYYHYLHDVDYIQFPSTLLRIENNAFWDTRTDYSNLNTFNTNTKYDLSRCENLVYIGSNAFGSDDTKKGEVIGLPKNPSKLTEIGAGAFRNTIKNVYVENNETTCPALISVGNEAFKNCNGLKKFDLQTNNNKLTTIGESAFENCVNLGSIVIPRSCTNVGAYAFKGCSTLGSSQINNPVLSVGEFQNCTLFSLALFNATIDTIPSYCFAGCQTLVYDQFVGVKYIRDHAFMGSGIMALTSSDILEIGENAFEGASISTIKFDNIQRIDDYAFYGSKINNNSSSVQDLFTLPASITQFGTYVFKDCDELVEFTFNKDSVTASEVTEKVFMNEGIFMDCDRLNKVNFHDDTTINTVPKYAFTNCVSLKTLSIITPVESASLHLIDDYAFYNTGFEKLSFTNNQNTIGEYTFAEIQTLTEVNINVAMIGAYMFYECKNLTTVVIGSRVANSDQPKNDTTNWSVQGHAFEKCTSITSITFNNNTIGDYMFAGCTSLLEVEIPQAIEWIGAHSFEDCTRLRRATLGTTTLGEYMFTRDQELKEIAFKEGITSIPAYAFYQSYLTSVIIPSTVTFVGTHAFAESRDLLNITLNSAYIGDYMFAGCTTVKNIVLPTTTYVGEYAFMNCTALETADIDHVNEVSEGMFMGCEFLGFNTSYTMYIPVVANAGDYAFKGCRRLYAVDINSSEIGASMFEDCVSLLEVVVKNTTTEVGEAAFKGCTNLRRATLNNTKASAHMFDGCTGLLDATFSSNATQIGEYAFKNCTNITTVNIDFPNIDTIGDYAFQNCTNLTQITVNTNTSSIGEGAFNGCTSLRQLYIPFIGTSKCTNATQAATAQSLFGYMFGTQNNVGSVETVSNYSASGTYTSYIPSSLQSVIVSGEVVVQYGAFSNTSNPKRVIFECPLTTLQEKAFYNANGLETISLPATVVNVGDYAFAECDNLGNVSSVSDTPTINGQVIGKYMFQNDTALERVNLTNVTVVKEYAFSGCTGLVTANLNTKIEGDVLTSILAYAFNNCESLTNLILPNTITTIGNHAFDNCQVLVLHDTNENTSYLPSELTSIGEYAFYNNNALDYVVIPQKVATVGTYAFAECDSLLFVDFRNNILGSFMFYNDGSLKYVNLASPTSIPQSAFELCSSLDIIEIPSTVTILGARAFASSGLTRIHLPQTTNTIGDEAFKNSTSLEYATVLGNKVGVRMFEGCTSLKDVDIRTVTTIGDYAFYNCSSLLWPRFTNVLTSIGTYAFAKCSSLRNVVVPNSVTSIGMNIFWDDDIVELSVPFVGQNRSPSYPSTGWHNYNYTPYTLSWFFGASAATVNNSSYQGTQNVAGTAYSDAAKSYAVLVYYYSYWGWGGSTTNGESKYERFYYPQSLRKITVTDAPTIPVFAFWGCKTVTDLTISPATTTICEYTMYGMSALENLTVPFIGRTNGNTSWLTTTHQYVNNVYYSGSVLGMWFLSSRGGWTGYYNSNLVDTINTTKTVQNANGHTGPTWESYGESGYYVPASLRTINVVNNDNVNVSIQEGAFNNLTQVTSINFNCKLVTLGKNALTNTSITEITLPQSLTSIGDTAANNNVQLVTLNAKNSLIQNNMFVGCTALENINLTGANTTIGSSAFGGCTSLTSLTLGQNVISIGNMAFEGCKNLRYLSTYAIGTGAESGVGSQFTSIFGETAVDTMTLAKTYYSASQYISRYVPTGLNIVLNGNIPQYAFANITGIGTVTIGEEVTEIGAYAFKNAAITSIRIPRACTTIGDYAFMNSSLEEAIFAYGLTTIQKGMFKNCQSLETLKFEQSRTITEYRYVQNNVYQEFINGNSTNNYVCAGDDLAFGTADDIRTNIIRRVNANSEESFYIDNLNGTYRSLGSDKMLGTADDQLVDNQVSFEIRKINNVNYRYYGKGIYQKLIIDVDSETGLVTYTLEGERLCYVQYADSVYPQGTLNEVVEYNTNYYLLISTGLYREAGRDNILGTEDDTYYNLGTDTQFGGNDDISEIIIYDFKYYKTFYDNVYQEVVTTEYVPAETREITQYEYTLVAENSIDDFDTYYVCTDPVALTYELASGLVEYSQAATYYTRSENTIVEVITPAVPYSVKLAEKFCAGLDMVIGTEDDVTGSDLLRPEINSATGQTEMKEYHFSRIVYNETEKTHYIVLRDGSYLGYDQNGMLGTQGGVVLGSASGNVVPQNPVVPFVDKAKGTVESRSVSQTYMTRTNEMSQSFVTISDEAFMYTSSLESIILSPQLLTIGRLAFAYSGLTSIEIPDTVTAVDEYVFSECKALETATIKTTINGNYMFSEDTALTTVNFAQNTLRISDGMFKN
nr:leucine-rich repeat domain-containing protein [Gammaproteobacteria bacterium]